MQTQNNTPIEPQRCDGSCMDGHGETLEVTGCATCVDSPTNRPQDTVTVSVDDLFAMLYRVPMYARDGAFSRIAAALPSFDTGREQCIECEQFRAVDLLCDCEQDMEAPR